MQIYRFETTATMKVYNRRSWWINALKTKRPMYIDRKDGDPLQIGYVITGKAEFDKGNG